MTNTHIILSVLLVSAIALAAILPLKKQPKQGTLIALLSLSAGTLLATVFVHFLPEIAEEGFHLDVGLTILAGFLVFFLLEKWIHNHHHGHKHELGHGHAYHLAPLNIIGDSLHNFLDGLVIAGAYMASIPVGIAATISVLLHELPQEIADYGVLLYSGMTKKKAIMFNIFAAFTAVVGAIIGISLGDTREFERFIIPFATGNFLYIAAASLVPELHKHCKFRETLVHTGMMLLGIAIMVLLAVPVH